MMTKDEQIYHVPVLLEQSILGLNTWMLLLVEEVILKKY